MSVKRNPLITTLLSFGVLTLLTACGERAVNFNDLALLSGVEGDLCNAPLAVSNAISAIPADAISLADLPDDDDDLLDFLLALPVNQQPFACSSSGGSGSRKDPKGKDLCVNFCHIPAGDLAKAVDLVADVKDLEGYVEQAKEDVDDGVLYTDFLGLCNPAIVPPPAPPLTPPPLPTPAPQLPTPPSGQPENNSGSADGADQEGLDCF